MKKLFSFLMILVLTMSMGAISFAAETSGDSGMFVGDAYITGELKEYIEENGVDIQEDDYIDIINSTDTARNTPATALRIIQNTGNQTEEYIFSCYEKQSSGEVIAADVPVAQSNTRTVRTISYSPSNSIITIVASVGYTVEVEDLFTTYIKPYGTNFSYTKNQSCTVNSINASFQTEGILCDASGNQITAPYVFDISLYQANPVAGRVYQKNASLPSGRKILYIGNIDYGVWLTIDVTINGSWSGRTYNMG